MIKKAGPFIFLVACVVFSNTGLKAHYHAVTPEKYSKWSARKGESVACRLIWGHGYAHIWFDVAAPQSFAAITPDGSRTDLAPLLKEIKVKAVSGEDRLAYAFTYQPAKRGDHVLSLVAGKQWDEEDGVWLQDYAKTVLHVQSESDWDRKAGHRAEIIPLSRPYGLIPGDALTFKALHNGKPAAGVRAERELLSEKTPAESSLPAEPFIAFSAKTDERGMVTFSFPGPGWYGVTVICETDEKHKSGGHEGPVVERATFWVYVSPKPE
jgi:cobalt/nickel transport protein